MHLTEKDKQYFLDILCCFGGILCSVWPTFRSCVLYRTYLLKWAIAKRNRQITEDVTSVLPCCAMQDSVLYCVSQVQIG